MKTVILPNTIKDIVIKNTLMKNNSLFDVEYITLDTFINEVTKMQITKKYRKESIYTYETKNNHSRRRTACD